MHNGWSKGHMLFAAWLCWACAPTQRTYDDEPGGEPQAGEGGAAGSKGTHPPENAIGKVGDACSAEGTYGCAGTNQRAKLVCMKGIWQANGECSSGERCDTQAENTGLCEPIIPECSGKAPGDAVCRERERFVCGPDLVTREKVETCEGGCSEGQCTECQPGGSICVGNAVKRCSDSGEWEKRELCDSSAPHCSEGTCGQPPSCDGLAADCGAMNDESCCVSLLVEGGTFNRINDAKHPATVSDFRLDKYEVTVGRFRKFKVAWDSGWRPSAGSGKHSHLNDGKGLVDSSGTADYEPGWSTTWVPKVSTSDSTRRAGENDYATWTSSAGTGETRPINFVNWFEAYAFCIWDGGFLPSEAEWNYAAAGGSQQRKYPWGAAEPGEDAHLAVYGCYYNGTGECTGVTNIARVGSVPAGNGRYGHADLAGNQWEWVLDRSIDPLGSTCDDCAHFPSLSDQRRVARGGSYRQGASTLTTSTRSNPTIDSRIIHYGFRCARTP